MSGKRYPEEFNVGCWRFIPVAFTPVFSSRIHYAISQT